MIQSFRRAGAEDIFNGRDTRAACGTCPSQLWTVAARKLEQLDSADELRDLHSPPGNHLEVLRGRRSGQHSFRINDQYRICFVWSDAGPKDVEIVDYHERLTRGVDHGAYSNRSCSDSSG